MKVTVELEIDDISKKMVLFEHVGELSTGEDGVKLQAYRDVPLGSPIVYAPDGRRYMISLRQIYQVLAREIMEGSLKQ